MVWIRARLTVRYLPSTRIDGVVLFRLALLVILQSDQLPSPERWVSAAVGERSCLTPRSITIERHVRRGSDRQRSSLASSAHLSCKSSGLHGFDVGDFLEGHRKKAFLPPPGTRNPTGIMATSRPPSRDCNARVAATPTCCRQPCSRRSISGPSGAQRIRQPRVRNAPITESRLRQPARRGLGSAS